MDNTKKDIAHTEIGNRSSKRKAFLLTGLPKKVADFQSRILNKKQSDDLKGEGMKIIILLNNIDNYLRLEVLLGLKLSGLTNTPKNASNLTDELYKKM